MNTTSIKTVSSRFRDQIIADGRVSLFDLGDSIGVEFPDDGNMRHLQVHYRPRRYLPEAGTSVNGRTGVRFESRLAAKMRWLNSSLIAFEVNDHRDFSEADISRSSAKYMVATLLREGRTG